MQKWIENLGWRGRGAVEATHAIRMAAHTYPASSSPLTHLPPPHPLVQAGGPSGNFPKSQNQVNIPPPSLPDHIPSHLPPVPTASSAVLEAREASAVFCLLLPAQLGMQDSGSSDGWVPPLIPVPLGAGTRRGNPHPTHTLLLLLSVSQLNPAAVLVPAVLLLGSVYCLHIHWPNEQSKMCMWRIINLEIQAKRR